MLAKIYGIRVTSPRFGVSGGDYACDPERRIIAKGLSSIKFIGGKVASQLQEVSTGKLFQSFSDVLFLLEQLTDLDAKQLSILIHIDYFADYGNQRELDNVVRIFDMFKKGDAKQIRKDRIAGSYFEEVVSRHATGVTKAGKESSNWILHDVPQIIRECEERIKGLNLPDLGILTKVRNFAEAMGYSGYVSGREEDRPILYIKEVFPVKRKRDGAQFAYNILTQSIGSGIESRFTIFNKLFASEPVAKGDIILCKRYRQDGAYFTMTDYMKIRTDLDLMEDL